MTRRFRVVGRVQGVAFRGFVQGTALRLGLAGWVRNEPDGSVTGAVAGPDDAVTAFVAALHRGPPAALVRSVDVVEDPDAEAPRPFQFRD